MTRVKTMSYIWHLNARYKAHKKYIGSVRWIRDKAKERCHDFVTLNYLNTQTFFYQHGKGLNQNNNMITINSTILMEKILMILFMYWYKIAVLSVSFF